jgi:hypothetical protein
MRKVYLKAILNSLDTQFSVLYIVKFNINNQGGRHVRKSVYSI